jgi:16S rRNA (cytosine967-C5)-methyltransferase
VKQTARSVALEAIRRVTDEGAYSTIVVPGALRRSRLDGRDRAFATDLAFGTLRNLISIDWALDRVASRPVKRMSANARAVLRLGAYQTLFGDVAAHAAVGETVGLAHDRERGFVNAVLRRLAAEPPEWPGGEDDADVSVRTGLSTWSVHELRRLLPADEVEPAAASLASKAPLCIRTNTAAVDPDELRRALVDAGLKPRPAPLDATCFLLDGGDPAALPGFEEGWFAVQDQASAFVVRALDPRPGERVLDACAAPGGKATAIAADVGDDGLVIAGYVHPRRAASIRRAADRLRVRMLVLAQDAAAPALRGSFDGILVDAPCSGVGSARRRPELLWRDAKRDLSRLARTQVRIVAVVADLLRPGGRLVYSVCTFPRAETDAAADAIVRHRPDLHPVAIDGPDGRAERVRLWPHRHGSDGMFVAAFVRAARPGR